MSGSVLRRIVLLAAFLGARPLAGQVVAGTVVLPDSATAAVGVIVIAVDDRGREIARALSNGRGEYLLSLPAAGRYSLKVLRIGYRPTIGSAVSVVDGERATSRIVLATEAVTLTALDVRDRETCRVNADTGLMVARVWEEARKAMLSTQLNSGAAPLFAEWIEYDQTLDSSSRIVRAQRVRTARNPTTHAFRSRPAAYLDTAGYVVSDNSGTTYFAPDAEVLLSDLFAGGHCFRLAAPPRERPELIGVAFTPSRDRRERREIQGTLWLDRTTDELRSLEFTYTNLHEVALAARAGGRVEFLRLMEGSWLVSRWSLRMPQLEAQRAADIAFQRTVMSRRPVLRAVQVTGGEVTRVVRGDSLMYAAVGPRVSVQVIGDSSIGAGARVHLEGTDYKGMVNAAGRVELAPVLAGRYRAVVRTPLMDSLGLPPVASEVEARTDARVDTLRLPGTRDVLMKVCPRDSVAHGEGMLQGTVRTERASPLPLAVVVASWNENVSIIGDPKTDHLRYTEKSLGTIAGNDGTWRICGVPRQTAIVVRVVSDSGRDLQKVRLDADFTTITLVARRLATESTREMAAALGQSDRATALVEFTVISAHGLPLSDVTLEVRAPGAPVRTIATGPTGRALLPDVSPGMVTVKARRIGFKQGEVAASVASGRNTLPIVLSDVVMPSLDTVRVVGDRVVLARHDEFETRRLRKEATVSITEEEIHARNPVHLWQMLEAIPSVRLIDSGTVVAAVSTRTMVTSIMNQGPCYLVIVVDGILMNPDPNKSGFNLKMLPAPSEIHGIEVFAGASSIPVKYGGTGNGKWCGMIAFWTK